MKTEDIVSIYEFLSTVSWIGSSGVILLLMATRFSSLFLFGNEKIELTERWAFSTFIFIALVSISITRIKIDADNGTDKLMFANCAMTEFVISGCKVLKDEGILQRDCKLLRDNLEDLLTTFPFEFIHERIGVAENAIGVTASASPAKIDDRNIVRLPFFVNSRILSHKTQNSCENTLYRTVRKKIDNYFDGAWIDLMVSKIRFQIRCLAGHEVREKYILKIIGLP